MNTFSDETLMAFADDELDPTMRAAVAAAMRDDPEIGRRIARHRALRGGIHLAYSADLRQPSRGRVLVAARGRDRRLISSATVTDLAAVRAAGVPAAGTANAAPSANAASSATTAIAGSAFNDTDRSTGAPPSWSPAAALAATLLIGVAVGYFAMHRADPVVADNGGWVAGGELAAALSSQLGGDRPADGSVQTPLSFVSKSGDYCRVFSLTVTAAAGGIACRRGNSWRIRMLVDDDPHSPLILGAVRSQAVGEPLDHDGEIKARQAEWRPVARAAPRNR